MISPFAFPAAMPAPETWVIVSKSTLEELDRLRSVWHTESADQTIQKLISDWESESFRAIVEGRKVSTPVAGTD